MKNVDSLPFEWYVDKISSGEPFALSRYGDGEFNAIRGEEGSNCDGHEYFPELGADLRHTLDKPHPEPFIYGLQTLIYRRQYEEFKDSIGKYDHIPWVDSGVFHTASIKGLLYPLIKILRSKSLLVVGPAHIEGFLEELNFAPIPDKNCYEKYREIYFEAAAKTFPVEVVAISASMAANVLVYDLWKDFYDKQIIDFGSLWDVFCGHPSRAYQRNMSPEIKEKNLCPSKTPENS